MIISKISRYALSWGNVAARINGLEPRGVRDKKGKTYDDCRPRLPVNEINSVR